MKTYQFHAKQYINRPLKEVFAFFQNPENLSRITPPWLNFKITTNTPIAMEPGALIDYQIKLKGLPLKWRTEITHFDPPHSFVDVQLKGPYAKWHHTHRFEAVEDGTQIYDDVEYALPLGILGQIAHRLYVKGDLQKIFEYRKQIIEEIFHHPKSE